VMIRECIRCRYDGRKSSTRVRCSYALVVFDFEISKERRIKIFRERENVHGPNKKKKNKKV